MTKYTLVSLSVAGGILSGCAWTGWCTGLVLLIAFIPFFLIENHIFENRLRFTPNAYFIYLLPGMFIFCILAIGWMRVASITGAVCVISGLAFLMSLALWLAHLVRLRAGNIPGFIAIFAFWLAYEYISLNVNIISPWLNLGNGLSKDILFIQWYELTGTAGGTVWILFSNLILTIFIVRIFDTRRNTRLYLLMWLLSIIFPSALSITRYLMVDQNKTGGEEVIIVQPNIDPYTEKFTIPFNKQLTEVIELAKTAISDNTTWIITPETTVDDPVNLEDLNNDRYIKMIMDLVNKFPKATVVSGLVSYRVYPSSSDAPTVSARRINTSGNYYDHYNSAFKIDTSKSIEVYHKSKLVPGIEMQFSNGPGRIINRILPSLGGTKWGYGIQKERECFGRQGTSEKIGTIICYESVFGKYVTEYVKKGANALFIITNDGWWKNSNGFQQHLSYASVRAIETRRQVTRAANTGISCIIDIRGKRSFETDWWRKAVIKGEIFMESRITPYVRYGDYLLRSGSIISVLILLFIFIIVPFRKKLQQFFRKCNS